MAGAVRVFMATSLDGFIEGPDGDLSWLPEPEPGDDPREPPPDYGYHAFIAQIGAMLMGRNSYDFVAGYDGPWPYGEMPMLVATHRELEPAQPSVRAVSGTIAELVAEARAAAGDRDVYVDGGDLVRQALDAGFVESIVLTVVPVILGSGTPLFTGAQRRQLRLVGCERFDDAGLVQLSYSVGAPA